MLVIARVSCFKACKKVTCQMTLFRLSVLISSLIRMHLTF